MRIIDTEGVLCAYVCDEVVFFVVVFGNGSGCIVLVDRNSVDIAVVGRQSIGVNIVCLYFIVEVHTCYPIFNRFQCKSYLLVDVVGRFVVFASLQEVSSRPSVRIEFAVVVVERQIRPVLSCEVFVESVVHGRGLVVVFAHETNGVVEFHPVGERCLHFACCAVSPQVLFTKIQESFLVHVVGRDVEIDFFVTSACAQVMLVRKVVVFEEDVVPIGIGVSCSERVLPLCATCRHCESSSYFSPLVCENTG